LKPDEPLDLDSLPLAGPSATYRRPIPLVWLIPIVAAVIGAWIAVHAILQRGPTITVSFADAEGIEVGKTKVRYKNVDLGLVRSVTLAPDHHRVNVTIDMANFATPFLVKDTRFWIVRPRLGATGFSGIGTLFSGDYLGMDIGTALEPQRQFTGLEAPPVIVSDAPGREFVLEAHDLGSLGVGAPAYFRHIQVGRVSSVALDPGSHEMVLKLFVLAPYDQLVTSDSRFWHASGVDVAVNSDGVRVQTQSLATILAGGLAFDSPVDSTHAAAAAAETHFRLADNREAAMKAPDNIADQYRLYFDDSLRGLSVGATVDFHGVEIGEVVAMNVEYDRSTAKFAFPVLINVYPERIRARYQSASRLPPMDTHALVVSMVEHGFRAQLRTSSLLTGKLYVALDFFAQEPAAHLATDELPLRLPTIPGNLEELQSTVTSVAHKLDRLPLAAIAGKLDSAAGSLDRTLTTTNQLMSRLDAEVVPAAAGALTQARQTLAQTQATLSPDGSVRGDLHDTLSSIARAADSLRALAEYLDAHPESLIRGKPVDPP